MTRMLMTVTIKIFSALPSGEQAEFEVRSMPLDFGIHSVDVSRAALEAYSTARFLVAGGTGHPTDPWNKGEEESVEAEQTTFLPKEHKYQ